MSVGLAVVCVCCFGCLLDFGLYFGCGLLLLAFVL